MIANIPERYLNHIVLVTWLDHVGLGAEWTSVKKARKAKPSQFQTLGFLLNITDRAIVLAPTLEFGNVKHKSTGDVTVLVRGAITEIRAL